MSDSSVPPVPALPVTELGAEAPYAIECCAQHGIENPMLVDDLDGTVHRLYGVMPNMVYVVDKAGKIAYKAMWTDHQEIEPPRLPPREDPQQSNGALLIAPSRPPLWQPLLALA